MEAKEFVKQYQTSDENYWIIQNENAVISLLEEYEEQKANPLDADVRKKLGDIAQK